MKRTVMITCLLGAAILLALSTRQGDMALGPGNSFQPAAPEGTCPRSPAPPLPALLSEQRTEFLFDDNFPGGNPLLPWKPYPFFNGDNLHGALDPTSPGGNGGVGMLANENAGGFAALSYVERDVPHNFYLESWVYLTVTEGDRGPLNGLAFRVDPEAGRFYRLASHFTAESTVTLAYVGRDTNNFPAYLGTWKGNDLPGGAPALSGWHRLGIEVTDNRAEVYWDGIRLPGGPFPVDRIPSGFVGVYANFVGGLGRADTRVADFRVSRLTPESGRLARLLLPLISAGHR